MSEVSFKVVPQEPCIPSKNKAFRNTLKRLDFNVTPDFWIEVVEWLEPEPAICWLCWECLGFEVDSAVEGVAQLDKNVYRGKKTASWYASPHKNASCSFKIDCFCITDSLTGQSIQPKIGCQFRVVEPSVFFRQLFQSRLLINFCEIIVRIGIYFILPYTVNLLTKGAFIYILFKQ